MLQSGKVPGTPVRAQSLNQEKGLLHIEKDSRVGGYIQSRRGNYNENIMMEFMRLSDDKPLPFQRRDGVKVITIIEAAYQSSQRN